MEPRIHRPNFFITSDGKMLSSRRFSIPESIILTTEPAGTVTWDPNNKSANSVLSNNNLNASTDSTSAIWAQALATFPRSVGKYYFEIEQTLSQAASNASFGVQNGSESLDSYVGDTVNGWGYMSNGRWYHDSVLDSTPTLWSSSGSKIGCAVDLDNHKIWFTDNTGAWYGDPGIGTGEAYSNLTTGDIYPSAGPYYNYQQLTGKFKASDMAYTIPTGFSAWES